MKNTKRKLSFALALLMTVSLFATGCKKTDEDSNSLTDTSAVTVAPITQMTTEETTEETTTEATTKETAETTTEETTETTTETTTGIASDTKTTETTTKVTEAASKDWNETEINEVMYTTQSCYSRKRAIVGAETVAQYKKGTKVNVVAATDTGYYKLDDGSFIHSDYLSEEKTPATTQATTAKTNPTNPDENKNPGTSVVSTSYNIDYKTRYAYGTLTTDEKMLYGNIVDAVSTLAPTVEIPTSLLSDDVKKVYALVYYQEPQLFWMSSTPINGYGQAKLSYAITDKSLIASMQKDIDANVKSIMSEVNKYSSTVSKLKVIYDWIVLNSEFSKTTSYEPSAIYNGLTKGAELQCAGYAKTMMYLCDIAGIECITIIGTNPEQASHAWNVVYCDNGYYNIDATWGDPSNKHNSKYVRYNFFLVPDAWIVNDHVNVNILTLSSRVSFKLFNPPSCEKTACNYFKAYNKEFSTLETATQGMYDELASAIAAGKNVAHIRVTDSNIYDSLTSNSYAVTFQKYAKNQGDVARLSPQYLYTDGVLVVQYDIFYN